MAKNTAPLLNVKNFTLSAKNDSQKQAIITIKSKPITFISGPPGTGKTHIPVVYALQELARKKYDRIILTRPCVEAYGENLGFLPGDFHEKIAPYMLPIFDIIGRYLDAKTIQNLVNENKIITLPLAYQRGITFSDAFVLLDEAQNTIPEQMRMFLTRMGEECKIVVTGDPAQNDIKGRNGLVDALERFSDEEEIGIVKMSHDDIVRNHLVQMIDQKYAEDKG